MEAWLRSIGKDPFDPATYFNSVILCKMIQDQATAPDPQFEFDQTH